MLSKISVLTVLIVIAAVSFSVAQDHHHGKIDIKCEECHHTEGWDKLKPVLDFNHDKQTEYPLEGRHETVGCTDCHTSLVFTETGSECISCHDDIHEGQFADACSECHNPSTWQNEADMTLRHAQTRYPLVGVHDNLDCQACHASGQYVNLPLDCDGCHVQRYLNTTNPDHTAAAFPTDCSQCHSINHLGWLPATYEHSQEFPLVSGHRISDCSACHEGQSNYSDSQTECFACHEDNYNESTNPNHVAANLSQTCEDCHTIIAWKPAEFDHNLSDFQLTGAHVTVDCAECHTNGQYTGIASDCYSCHQADYASADDPDHEAGQFSNSCEECHTTTVWNPSTFNHDEQTNFQLTGAHITVNCQECHIGGQFAGTSTECFGCHEDSYNETTDPDHEAGQFSHSCEECHTTTVWNPSTFNHDEQTNFQLTGAHVTVNCQECHIDGQFAGTSTECFGCHEDDYNETTDPDHEAGQLSHNCEECHTTTVWNPSTFDHDVQTDFPLTGAHITVNCQECHVDGQFDGTTTECFGCHEDDYEAVEDPDHVAGQFNTNCLICHTTATWIPSTLNHDETNFPLTGAHVTVNCEECHVDGQYAGTPTECFACHEDDYNETTDPDHETGQFSHSCEECHTTTVWNPSTFNHNEQTDFPLEGAHVAVDCQECHIDGQFDGTSTECFGCHEDDYEGVDDPSHVEGQFDHDCTTCHSNEAWTPATFDHDNTDFPLVGAHVNVSCQECHADGQFEGTTTECFGCHEGDYEGVDDPNHIENEFDRDCSACHNTEAWSPADFDHDETDFPLTGAHRHVDCAECHVDGQFAGTPSECFDCHEDDYNNARYQGSTHRGARFPHDCEQCHNTNDWEDADFNHDREHFPIFRGEHRGEWDRCTDCHTDANDFTVFSCIDCHEHNRRDMDDEHEDVRDYRYESVACYECHPNGEEDDDFMPPELPPTRSLD